MSEMTGKVLKSRFGLVVMVVCLLMAATASTVEPVSAREETSPVYDQWPVDTFHPIPYTDFNTTGHSVVLEFLASDLQSRFVMDDGVWITFPVRQLPVKLLELPDGRFIVFTRHLFEGILSAYTADAAGALVEIAVPEHVRCALFKQAVIFQDELLAVVYNVHSRNNYLVRWDILEDGSIVPDVGYFAQIDFGGRYEIDANVHMVASPHVVVGEDDTPGVYIAGANTVHIYTNWDYPHFYTVYSSKDLELVEFHAEDDVFGGLYRQDNSIYPDRPLSDASIYRAVDSDMQETSLTGIPYNLRYEHSVWIPSQAVDTDALWGILEHDLKNSAQSGLMDLGTNNYEGRIPWSQVYYLNGFIDLLVDWEYLDEQTIDNLNEIRPEIKQRLDLEIYLIDRLLDEGEPGLTCMRYTVDRDPAVFAVQTSRVAHLMSRYQRLVPDPLPLTNYAALLEDVESLNGTVEILVQATGDEPDLTAGHYYLEYPRGSSFPFDGANVPFNYQTQWAGTVAYVATDEYLDTLRLRAARDMIETVMEVEGFYTEPPEDHQWHYWWGWGRDGWVEEDGISINRPTYIGYAQYADITYRTMDVMGTLFVGQLFPDVMPEGFVDYVAGGIEQGKLLPFAAEALLEEYDTQPTISASLATYHLRTIAPWMFQNNVWAYFALSRQGTIELSVPEISEAPSQDDSLESAASLPQMKFGLPILVVAGLFVLALAVSLFLPIGDRQK